MVQMQSARAENAPVAEQVPEARPVPDQSLENSSLTQPSLRDSGLQELRTQNQNQRLSAEERTQSALAIAEARQLAREEGLALQKRATGSESENVPSLEERLKERGITVSLDRLNSDPAIAQSLNEARQAGVREGRAIWTDANATASALYNAMQGWGTDEAAIFSALEGKSPQDIKAIREAYKANYNTDLDTRLQSELGGSDLDRARDLMTGDAKTAAAAELYWSMKGAGTDEAAIQRILSRPDVADIERIFNERYAGKYGAVDLHAALQTELGGDHLKQAQNLVAAGDPSQDAVARADAQARADAAELHYAMKGFGGMGTDEATLHRVLGRSLDSQQLDRLSTAYRAEYGVDLHTHLQGELSSNDAERAQRLLAGDKVGADVAALKASEWGWGIDRNGVREVFEGASDAHRAAVLERYQQQQGQSFQESVQGQVNKEAQSVIGALAERGKLSDAEALIHAMSGVGTDEAALMRHLEGKSKEDIAQIREEYRRISGRDLDNDINWEVSGQYQFDATAALRGKPETVREIYQAMEERYAYERSGWNLGTDLWSDQGRVLDRQISLARERMARIESGTERTTDREDFAGLYDVHQVHARAYRQAKDAIVDTAATVATIAVATGTVIATGGTALGFWATVAIGTAAAAAARVTTKVAGKGDRYDWGGELATDIGISALEAGTAKFGAVVSEALSKTRLIAQLGSRGISGRAAATAMDGAVDGFGSGAISGVGETALTTDFSGKGAGEILENLALSGTLGAFAGGVGGAGIGAGLNYGVEKFVGRSAREVVEESGASTATRAVREQPQEAAVDAAQHTATVQLEAPTPAPHAEPVQVRTVNGVEVGNIPAEAREYGFENMLAKLSQFNNGQMSKPISVNDFHSLISDGDGFHWFSNLNLELRTQLSMAITQNKLTGDMLLDAMARSTSNLNHGQALITDYLTKKIPFEKVDGIELTISPGQTYLFESEVGDGGFAKVVMARQIFVSPDGQRVLGEPVALKITQVFRARDLDLEVRIPQEIDSFPDTRIRSSRPIDAVRFNSPEMSDRLQQVDVGIIVMNLIEGQPISHYLDGSFEVGRDAAAAARVISQLADEYDELYRRGWGITDAHGGNVLVAPGRNGSAPQLIHIDRAATGAANSAEVYIAQLTHLGEIAGSVVDSWRKANPGIPDPLHIQLMSQIEYGIHIHGLNEFSDIANVFRQISEALAEPNSAWSRQKLRGIQRELDSLGIERQLSRGERAVSVEF